MKRYSFVSGLLCLFVITFTCIKVSQGQEIEKSPDALVVYSESWFTKELSKVPAGVLPDVLSKDAITRLKQGYYLNDSTVIRISNFYISAESESSKPKYKLDESKVLIKDFIDLVKDRNILKLKLHDLLREIYLLEGDKVKEEEETEFYYEGMEELHATIQVSWMESVINLADLRVAGGEKKEAEILYLKVFDYRWSQLYSIPDAMHSAKALYERAGKTLIGLRQGDIERLSQISLYPSTSEDLKKYLEDSLKYARDKKQKNDEEMKAFLERNLKQKQ